MPIHRPLFRDVLDSYASGGYIVSAEDYDRAPADTPVVIMGGKPEDGPTAIRLYAVTTNHPEIPNYPWFRSEDEPLATIHRLVLLKGGWT